MKIDYEMLQEDVKFPLKWDSEECKTYIFDSDNNMVAMTYFEVVDAVAEYHPFEKLVGGYNTPIQPRPPFKNRYTLYQGDFYDKELRSVEPIGCVRGWGRLQYKDRPEERQNNIAAYILNVINNEDNRKQALIEMMQQDQKDGLYMVTKDKEVQQYLESIGWEVYTKSEHSPKISNLIMGDDCYGDTWYATNREEGFNTGANYYLAFRCDIKIDDPVLIAIYEDYYGSYSCSQNMNQYKLENIKQLPELMKFKRL